MRTFLLISGILLAPVYAEAGRMGNSAAIPDNSNEAIYRERSGFLNHYFDEIFQKILAEGTRPDENWLVSDYELLGAVKIIVSRADIPEPKDLHLLMNKYGLKIPAEIFALYESQLRAGFKHRLALPDLLGESAADELEKQAVEAAGLSYEDYVRVVPRPDRGRSALAGLMDFLQKKTHCSLAFDIPFVAGYAAEDGLSVYVDRHVPAKITFHGQEHPIEGFLIVHEAVEKAVMDEFSTTYPHAHQNALRIERAVVEAGGYDWSAYDSYMDGVISRIGNEVPTKVPANLDLTPYYSYIDPGSKKLVEQLKAAQKNDAR